VAQSPAGGQLRLGTLHTWRLLQCLNHVFNQPKFDSSRIRAFGRDEQVANDGLAAFVHKE
jgi:hypothetical protein